MALQAWAQVKVNNEALARHGEAGVTQERDAEVKADEAAVKFDRDGEVEIHKEADLIVLTGGA